MHRALNLNAGTLLVSQQTLALVTMEVLVALVAIGVMTGMISFKYKSRTEMIG